ncbi:TOM1-like protein 2 isoform X1, partial [Dinothrombium tinctorium]
LASFDRMAGILQQLSGNPLSTPIGQKIEQATDASLLQEDWTLNMEICDMISDTDEGPKDAIRAIKKRLQQNAGKNHTVVMYTLTILETCVKNCGKRFHLLVTNKDFIQELIKIIGPKYDPPPAVQEKASCFVLSLIQTWAETFRGQPEFSGVVQAYSELKQKGIEFPASNSEGSAPILTPQRSVPVTQQVSRNIPPPGAQTGNQQPSRTGHKQHTPRHVMSGPLGLSSEQLAKLRSELDIVQGNVKVFNDMLNELTPGNEHSDDWELLYQLYSTCQAMQKRIVELIEKVANEDITIELLRINDEINAVFLRFEKFVKQRNQGKTSAKEENTKVEEASLIDLTEDSSAATASVTNKISNLNLGAVGGSAADTTSNVTAGGGDADFDMFAQLRSEKNQTTQAMKNNKIDNDLVNINDVKPDINGSQLQREEDFDEMEKWLKGQSQAQQTQAASIPNSEFDRFLAERASAADRLPPNNQQRQQQQNSKPKTDPFGL